MDEVSKMGDNVRTWLSRPLKNSVRIALSRIIFLSFRILVGLQRERILRTTMIAL